MTPEEKALRLRLKNDFVFYAQKCLKIRSKEGKVSPFGLNAAQQHIHAMLEDQLARTGRVRAVILKGRQQGCSTYVEGRFYWKVTHRRGVRAFILTHLEEASRNIYQIARRFHDNCPLLARPRTSHDSTREMVFDLLDSGYMVGTARSSGVGRSHTLQYFHGSEVAYWPQAAEHFAGVLQAVPDMAGTEIVLESTSAGASGFYYDLCRAAMAGENGFCFIFVPWFWQDEYRKDLPPDFSLTTDEAAIMELHGLDLRQMCWRRSKISELGGIHIFRREYPATPDEAFAADYPGALWSRQNIEENRVRHESLPDMRRIVVAVDPAVTSHGKSDETGIIVAGLGTDGHAYILADASGRYKPGTWASRVITLFATHAADSVVAEVNQGGEMVEYTLRSIDPHIPFRAVRASRGKIARAEPVAALDAQGKVHHVGIFSVLEDQMCAFDPAGLTGGSPDRVDARVWAVTDLMLWRAPSEGPRIWR